MIDFSTIYSKKRFRSGLVIDLTLWLLPLVLWLILENEKEEGRYPTFQVAILWLVSLFVFLWYGNKFLIHKIENGMLGSITKENRFLAQLLLTFLFSLLYINFSYLLFKYRYTDLPPSKDQWTLVNMYALIFLVPVLSIQFGALHLRNWKTANLEKERLQKEQVKTELLALKSHLSPHFLFNNLNVLSSLMDTDIPKAHDFLDGFCDVYRYVLKNKDHETITLAEELDFIESYSYLLKKRFSNGLIVNINVETKYHTYRLPPLTLQILFENAMKHNRLSESSPLIINVMTKGRPEIKIHNTLQSRNEEETTKMGTGLDNIRRRYKLLADQKITVKKGKSEFTVILPLL